MFAVTGPLIFYSRNPDGNFLNFAHYYLIGFLFFLIPQNIIHLSYEAINKGMEMEYNDIEKCIRIKYMKEGRISEFHLDDVRQIFYHSCPAFVERLSYRLSWETYNYSDIILNDGRKFRITSLMVYRLELPVGDRYKAVKRFYPYPNS